MIKLVEIVDPKKSRRAKRARVVLVNRPIDSKCKLLMESAFELNEGQTKQWSNGYTYRIDRRAAHHGGDQVHIDGPTGAWAYRDTGARSERSKYTAPATNIVKDIVADVFGLPRDIIEAHVVSGNDEELLIEVSFKSAND